MRVPLEAQWEAQPEPLHVVAPAHPADWLEAGLVLRSFG